MKIWVVLTKTNLGWDNTGSAFLKKEDAEKEAEDLYTYGPYFKHMVKVFEAEVDW